MIQRRHRLLVLTLVALVVLAGAAVALAASGPRKGHRYSGKTSQHRKVTARVTSDGKTLQLRFDQIFTCNNGHKKITTVKFLRQAPKIRADGTFDYHKTYADEPGIPGFDEVRTDVQGVTGRFTADGSRVSGTVTGDTTGKESGLHCTSKVTFSAKVVR
ncbi:hypothetical protein [Baekduia sp. Peel2402]|uniref:hypothetical protein n=1 Tax=Baekduia sp. Peel2402 TaxID=3458296 RepID=UPI00403E9BAC